MYSNWTLLKSEYSNNVDEYIKVAEWCNQNKQYKIVDDGDCYRVMAKPEPTSEEKRLQQIFELKEYLADTDYVANKLIEAVDDAELQDLKEKYTDVLKKRRQTRAKINELGA